MRNYIKASRNQIKPHVKVRERDERREGKLASRKRGECVPRGAARRVQSRGVGRVRAVGAGGVGARSEGNLEIWEQSSSILHMIYIYIYISIS